MRRNQNSSVVILFLILILVAALVVSRTRQAARFSSGNKSTAANPNRSVISTTRLGPPDIYPDPIRTPGVTNPDITQDNVRENICNPNWSTKSIRPPAHYTNELKIEQIREYGDEDTNPRDYEEDLIPLELGGNPTDPQNLWPEPYVTSIPDGGAHSKDRIENYLHRQVCSGNIALDEAQSEIATDWYRVYVGMTAN
jgi:hypothetical protein